MTIREELEALTDKDRILRADRVVVWASKNRNSAIAGKLEWNNSKAAHEFRLIQVRHLIEIHLFHQPEEPQYISLRTDRSEPGGGYRRMEDVLADRDLTEMMMQDALKELNNIQHKYGRLEALAGIWSAVADATKRFSTERPRLEGPRPVSRARRNGRREQPGRTANL